MNKAAFRTTVLTATLGVLVLALFACVNEPPSQVGPCGSGQENVPSCEPRDATGLSIFHPTVGGGAFDYELPTLEDVLNEGLHGLGASPTHVAFRGTTRIGTVRCGWRGVALTPGQREASLRFWLVRVPADHRDAPAQRLGGEPQAGGADLAAGRAEGTGEATQKRAVVDERDFLCEAAAPGKKRCVGL